MFDFCDPENLLPDLVLKSSGTCSRVMATAIVMMIGKAGGSGFLRRCPASRLDRSGMGCIFHRRFLGITVEEKRMRLGLPAAAL